MSFVFCSSDRRVSVYYCQYRRIGTGVKSKFGPLSNFPIGYIIAKKKTSMQEKVTDTENNFQFFILEELYIHIFFSGFPSEINIFSFREFPIQGNVA